MTVPVFAIEIPMIGSLANICGIFFGAVTAGIIGAIAINIIEKKVEKQKKTENIEMQIAKGNKVLNTQKQLIAISEKRLAEHKEDVCANISKRHEDAQKEMVRVLDKIFDTSQNINHDDDFAEIDDLLSNLNLSCKGE